MANVSVRRAELSDLDELALLFDGYRQFYEQKSDVAAAKKFLRERMELNESTIFIARVEGTAVGFTQLYPSFTSTGLARIFVLNDLFVSPDARRKNIGGALLEAAAEHARDTGAVRLTLSTAVTNTNAQALYERCGWTRDMKFFVYHFPVTPR